MTTTAGRRDAADRNALIQKVENDRGIFAYDRTPTHPVLAASLTREDYTLVPVPADMLDTPDDLARATSRSAASPGTCRTR